jgi:hypothetical protein
VATGLKAEVEVEALKVGGREPQDTQHAAGLGLAVPVFSNSPLRPEVWFIPPTGSYVISVKRALFPALVG